jgi:uncharacterized damage-inducible protein DinB
MARNTAWANETLLAAVAQLSQADYTAPRSGFFPSIKETLAHIYLIDLFYLDALLKGGVGRNIIHDTAIPDSATELATLQAASDQRLIAFCDAGIHPEDRVFVGWTAGPATEYVEDILLHLFQHQVHHRGQAHAMLSDTPVAPPQLDDFFPNAFRVPSAQAYLP